MSETHLGYGLSVGALLLFSSSILVTKVASSRISLSLGFLVATLVNVGFAALALTLEFALRSDAFQWNTPAFLLFAAAGGFATYLGRWFFYESVVRFGPSRASIFQASSPLFTAMMAWLFLGERISLVIASGMVMTLCGLVLVSYKPSVVRDGGVSVAWAPSGVSHRERLLQSVFLLGLSSSMAYAISNVLRGSAIRLWNEPVVGALSGAVFGLTLHLLFSLKKTGVFSDWRSADRTGLWLFALIGVCNILGQMGVIGAMRYIPLSVVALMTLCTPILVFPLSHLLFKGKDAITLSTLLGSALTLMGIVIIVLR